jgi:predicted DNA-binding ribbon-helix-helix protein
MIRKHSVVIAGHPTSISLEDEFWNMLNKIADKENISLAALICKIDTERQGEKPYNLSSAIRVYVLKHCLSSLLS